MATISFDLVSPENLCFSDEVGMIIVPGKDGDIGVLPGHSKILSSLRPGRLIIYGEDKKLIKCFFVTGGFVEINQEKCIVLAEDIDDMSLLEKSTIENKIKELESLDTQKSKEQLIIVKTKIEALNYSFYEKI